MSGFYQKLVAELGEQGARNYMRELRAKVKQPFNPFADSQLAKAAQAKSVISRKKNADNSTRASSSPEK